MTEVSGSIVSLIAAQSTCRPLAPAVSDGTSSLSYAELDARSTAVAALLIGHHVTANTPVGLLADRTLDSIVGLLGIMKAGAAYVPLDPSLPERRLEDIASLAGLDIVMAPTSGSRVLPPRLRACRLSVDAAEPDACALPEPASCDRLIYILFTSGSSGQPKGVAMPEAALRNLIHWHAEAMPLRPGARVLQLASLGFDVASQEILTTLAAGGELVLIGEAARRGTSTLLDIIEKRGIERVFLPVHALGLVAEASRGRRPASLRDVVTAGEPLLVTPQIERFFAGGECRLHNHYGPTETHVVTVHTLAGAPDAWPRRPPIGRPIANVEISLRNPALRPVAAGEAAEICIGGIALARGYVGRPDLTAERFVTDPATGDRLFRTGDLARLGPQGLEYIGRIDRQIKIRGHRVEPGEVEAVLAQQPSVAAAVVTACTVDGRKDLAAYVQPAATAVAAAAREAAYARMEHARVVWDAIYAEPEPLHDPTVDCRGWTDSASGRLISRADMRSWADATARRVRALRPGRVLEIGCGTGMILTRLLPHCDAYVGTDVSHVALEGARRACTRLGLSLERLTLACQPAHAPLPSADRFDTVVLNSVVELFPSRDYFLDVLRIAVAATRSGGVVFVGDVRNLALMEMFHTRNEVLRANPRTPVSELRKKISAVMAAESRLFVAPDFFQSLPDLLPRITGVEIQLRNDGRLTEMSRYRYDVILHVDRPAVPAKAPDADWRSDGLTLADLHRRQSGGSRASYRVTGIPNARLAADRALLQHLRETGGDMSVERLRALPVEEAGVQPEALWALATDTDEARISFDTAGQCGEMELLLLSRREASVLRDTKARTPTALTNDPLAGDVQRILASRLRRELAAILPDYLVPARIALVDAFPLTTSGKVDRAALSVPPPSRGTPIGSARYSSDIEAAIAGIWRDVLVTDDIDPDCSFFDHGGNSLLLVDVYLSLCSLLRRDIDFVILMRYPTVHALANYLAASSGSEASAAVRSDHHGTRRSDVLAS